MKWLKKNREQGNRALFYTAIIWLVASVSVFSKGFIMENDWKTAGSLLLINAVTVGTAFVCFYGIFADSAASTVSTAMYVLSVYRFERSLLERNIAELIFMAVLPLMFYEVNKANKEKGNRAVVMLAICGLVPAALDIGFLEITVFTLILTAGIVCCLTRKGKAFLKIGIALGVDCVVGGALWIDKIKFPDAFSLIQEKGLRLSGLLVEFWKIKSRIPGGEEEALYRNPLGIGLFTLAGMGIFLVLWLLGHIDLKAGESKEIVGAAVMTAALELFMTLRSFPWDRIQFASGVTYRIVGALQTPTAFLTPVIFGCVLAWGYLIVNYKKKNEFYYQICVAASVIAILVSGIYVRDMNNFTVDYSEMFQMQNGLETE